MPQPNRVIQRVRQTEKGARLAALRQYVLQVATEANKLEIKRAVEELFQVKVTNVNTQVYQGKWRRLTGRWGRRANWKKAIVTLAEGQKIEVK